MYARTVTELAVALTANESMPKALTGDLFLILVVTRIKKSSVACGDSPFVKGASCGALRLDSSLRSE
jgi:hypothetical protein